MKNGERFFGGFEFRMQPFMNISVSKTVHNQIFYRPSREKRFCFNFLYCVRNARSYLTTLVYFQFFKDNFWIIGKGMLQ
jgi:hypothetical protein